MRRLQGHGMVGQASIHHKQHGVRAHHAALRDKHGGLRHRDSVQEWPARERHTTDQFSSKAVKATSAEPIATVLTQNMVAALNSIDMLWRSAASEAHRL